MSFGQIEHSLSIMDGDVQRAADHVMASGKATEAAKEKFEEIQRLRDQLERREAEYAESVEAEAKRRAEREEAEKIAAQIGRDVVIDLTEEEQMGKEPESAIGHVEDDDYEGYVVGEEGEVVWGQPNPNFRLHPKTVETVFSLVKKHLYTDKEKEAERIRDHKPFWFTNEKATRDEIGSIVVYKKWVRLDSVITEGKIGADATEFTLERIEGDKLIFKTPQGTRRTTATTAKFDRGVLITKATPGLIPKLPALIEHQLVKRYKRARATDNAFLRTIMTIIPGVYGAEKRGKGTITKGGTMKLTNVTQQSVFFRFLPGQYGRPELVYSSHGDTVSRGAPAYESSAANTSPLTKITYDNANMIAEACDEFDKAPIILSAIRKKLAPHIAVMYKLAIDTAYYVDRATAEGNIAEQERQRQVALDRAAERQLQEQISTQGLQHGTLMKYREVFDSRGGGHAFTVFYRIVEAGEMTNGKGGLNVYSHKRPDILYDTTAGFGKTTYGLPSEKDRLSGVFVVYRKLTKVGPDETEFIFERWMGD